MRFMLNVDVKCKHTFVIQYSITSLLMNLATSISNWLTIPLDNTSPQPSWQHPPLPQTNGNYVQWAGGMHPTGMRSCFIIYCFKSMFCQYIKLTLLFRTILMTQSMDSRSPANLSILVSIWRRIRSLNVTDFISWTLLSIERNSIRLGDRNYTPNCTKLGGAQKLGGYGGAGPPAQITTMPVLKHICD